MMSLTQERRKTMQIKKGVYNNLKRGIITLSKREGTVGK